MHRCGGVAGTTFWLQYPSLVCCDISVTGMTNLLLQPDHFVWFVSTGWGLSLCE